MGTPIRVIRSARELKLQRDREKHERHDSVIREHLEREMNAKRTRERNEYLKRRAQRVNAYRATLALAFLGRRVAA